MTGLEMEHAFFRLPLASESFFFIRDHAFMHDKEALKLVPESAQLVFAEAKQEAKDFAEFLRKQVPPPTKALPQRYLFCSRKLPVQCD